ncbi:MAG: vanadium-dependent haloperoxidase [Gemmatimonadaceae bacterium]|nr:vanadium-dependent haloperoxidase [Gemmatimonadaceae bacterium]
MSASVPVFRAARLVPALLLLSVACGRTAPAPDPQLVAQWTRSSLAFVRTERLGPPVASRISAYAALALYEGFAADARSGLRTLNGQLNQLTTLPPAPTDGAVDGATVAAVAERIVLDSLFRDGFATTRNTVDSLAAAQVAARRAAGVAEAEAQRSEAHAQALAAAILAWAAEDGFFATRGRVWDAPKRRDQWENTATLDQYVPQTLSGQSDFVSTTNPNVRLDAEQASEKSVFTNRPKEAGPTTLPTFNPTRPTEPYWGTLRPFVIRDGDECAPPPPPAYDEKPGSAFHAMGQAFYDSVKALTPQQREIALFWADNPVATGTPGFHWISVVNQMIARRGLSAPAAAELYALTSLAIADAFIGCWKEKYRSMVVRPVAYVQRVFDPGYRTVIPTPPFPEYTSGHSVQSAAAVTVLIAQLGDTIAFVDSSQVDVGQPPRPFPSFSAARDEVAWSRVFAGVHYIPAVVDGVTQGNCIGDRVKALKTRVTP